MIKNIILCVAIMIAVIRAHADDISLGSVEYGGTGCPAGSASIALSPDQKALSILFDSYVVNAGGSTGKSFDRKNCNLALPVHIPQGFSVAVVAVDYRGFAGIPDGGRAQLAVNYFLAGAGRGLRTTKVFTGPTNNDYIKSDKLDVAAMVWTPCGADTILRTNTTLLVQSNQMLDDAMATVDSADIQAGLVYHLQWRSCR